MPVLLLQRHIFTSVGVSPPTSFRVFRLRKPIRYSPDRKNLIASEAQPGTFFTAKGVCLPLAPPGQIPQLWPSSLLAWLPAGNTRSGEEMSPQGIWCHSTWMPENLPNPTLFNCTATIKSEQLTVPFTFVQKPSLTHLEEMGRNLKR